MLENLETPPRGNDSFIWTDFAELRAILHPDKCFSRGDLSGIEKRCRDLDMAGFKSEERWREIVNFSGNRLAEFNQFYPFSISQDQDTINFEFDGGLPHIAYVGLLIASCMRNIARNRQAEIARAFEETCFEIFLSLMPPGSEVRATWANGGNTAVYTGTLYEKMKAIAKDLRCVPTFKERDFNQRDSGDGGIDLIAWHPMADDRAGMPIAFAQCGCSRDDWRFKHLEASLAKHGSKFPVMHPWANYYFMPIDLRFPDGDWAYRNDLGQAIFVDRLRLLRLAEQNNLFQKLPDMPYVNEALQIQYA
ncbi:hypothetical protein [Methylomonas fluvii]|uniref:Uncharacterized protein n=1 Tax=Methylomonas fluvii TaxID=1854564 RepID=A0ABR9DDQ0_9GAMM|nr:hypothetical protein [Methylomonas fluvii]MBD9360911.1 hypothetical protein [Methylomonas fluvii]